MGWKNLPSWLKGGIILDSLLVLIFLFYFFIWTKLFSDNFLILGLFTPGLILLWPITKCYFAAFMGGVVSGCPLTGDVFQILVAILSLIGWFIIGALIGWIYGKIRNRQ